MWYRKTHLKYLVNAASAILIGFKASLENLLAARLNSASKKWFNKINCTYV
jgi:hypothetical protein